MMTMRAAAPDLEQARRLVLEKLRGYDVEVYLYGSFAKGKGALGSDIDIALLPLKPIPEHVLSDLRHELEDSPVLYNVDLVDLSQTGSDFRRRVLREGIRWNE